MGQAALDPEVGQAEARSMEKEIHRMRLRLETLKRDQERMIKEMERAIYKREAISLRHRGQKKEELTQHKLKKQLGTLRGGIKKTVGETAEYETAIREKVENMESVGQELEVAST